MFRSKRVREREEARWRNQWRSRHILTVSVCFFLFVPTPSKKNIIMTRVPSDIKVLLPKTNYLVNDFILFITLQLKNGKELLLSHGQNIQIIS